MNRSLFCGRLADDRRCGGLGKTADVSLVGESSSCARASSNSDCVSSKTSSDDCVRNRRNDLLPSSELPFKGAISRESDEGALTGML